MDSIVDALITKLESERGRLLRAIQGLTPDQLETPGASGWSPRDILAHVAFSEQVNVKLGRLMVEHDRPDQLRALAADFPDYPGAFSLDGFNAYMTPRLRALSTAQAVELLSATRDETLAWAATLTPEQLERRGVHAVWGEQNVRDMLRILALHDKMHAQEIRNSILGIQNS